MEEPDCCEEDPKTSADKRKLESWSMSCGLEKYQEHLSVRNAGQWTKTGEEHLIGAGSKKLRKSHRRACASDELPPSCDMRYMILAPQLYCSRPVRRGWVPLGGLGIGAWDRAQAYDLDHGRRGISS
eukprot:722150-Pleurochrysis_carterae.AAC.1